MESTAWKKSKEGREGGREEKGKEGKEEKKGKERREGNIEFNRDLLTISKEQDERQLYKH